VRTAVASETEACLRAFDLFAKAALPGAASWTAPLRRLALDRFAELGYPTPRDEAWKYTSVAPIAKLPFAVAALPQPDAHTRSGIAPFLPTGLSAVTLVFVNGHFREGLSTPRALPAGCKVMSLGKAFTTERSLVEPHLAAHADHQSQAFTALNTAFMTDGAFVWLEKGAIAPEPIHLLFLAAPANGEGIPLSVHPRNLIIAGRGSQATIIETYASSGGGAAFTNAVTEIVLGDGASLEHYKIAREDERALHVARLEVYQEREAAFTSHSVAIGGALVRNDINVTLAAEGADCTLNGLYVLDGAQHADNHTTIDHAQPHGSSRELYKGLLGGRSRGVFDGKIIVRPDAQKTDARQVNRNLLLSEEALVNTKPQLEIRANDVKCTHAATIGQIDREMLFYIRSRGIDESTARGLLMRAFVSDVLSKMRIEAVRASLEDFMAARLATPCAGGSAS